MSPTVFREKGYRFYFFSLEEERMHVHVAGADGEAKFWLEPKVSLAMAKGLNPHQVRQLLRMVEEHRNEIANAWHRHLSG
jgi:hypothetical protein